MGLLQKVKTKLSHKDIRQQKAEKMAQTERFLHGHRQAYRPTAPLGFKPRSDSSYHFARAGR